MLAQREAHFGDLAESRNRACNRVSVNTGGIVAAAELHQ